MQHVAARLNSVKLGSDLDEATLGVGQLRQVKKRARGKLAFRGFNSKKKTASDLEIAPTRTLRQSKKDAFDLMAPVSMLQDWNSAHDRLQALQSRKRRESVSIEVPANVSMLKRFMVDVVQDESKVLGDGAGKGSDRPQRGASRGYCGSLKLILRNGSHFLSSQRLLYQAVAARVRVKKGLKSEENG